PSLDAVFTLGIDDGCQPYNAAVAPLPVPREEREGAAPAGDLVDVAADVLDAQDAVGEQLSVHRLPFGKILLPVAPARPHAVFLGEMGMQRPVALRPDRGCEGIVVGL